MQWPSCGIATRADKPKVIKDSEAIQYVRKEVEVCGRFPYLDLFFLADAGGHRDKLSTACLSPNSAVTSLLFSAALLFYDRRVRWRMWTFQIGTLLALILPGFGAAGYIAELILAAQTPEWLKNGLSLPLAVLYFTLGLGFFGLFYRSKE